MCFPMSANNKETELKNGVNVLNRKKEKKNREKNKRPGKIETDMPGFRTRLLGNDIIY